ncbi:MAG: type II secretion system protein M [Gammaproteobacteria bacterium]|nr:type II secretion system protein M [Gammaproteobacteria bacterium]
MSAWLQRMNPRERAGVIGATLVAAAVLLYLLVAEPLWNTLEEERARLQSQRTLLKWMQTSAGEVQQLRGDTSRVDKTGKAPYLLLDAAVRSSGLPAPARLEPRGRDGAAAQFENVPFDHLIHMLADIERRGELVIVDVSVTRRDAATVNASLALSREQ